MERISYAGVLRPRRRKALWEVTALSDKPAVLFSKEAGEAISEPIIELPKMALSEHVVEDYASMSLSLKGHPVSFVREKLKRKDITSNNRLHLVRDGAPIKVAGLVLVRQRPGTAGGVCFMTVEDETGFSNLVIFKNLFETFRKEILQSKLIMVEGTLQKEGEVIHIIVKKLYNYSNYLCDLTSTNNEDLPLLTLSRADEKAPEGWSVRHQIADIKEKAAGVIPEARNFR